MTEALANLLRRVEEATGPDRQLEREILDALNAWQSPIEHTTWITASIDAAVALAERVFPGWAWLTRTDNQHGAFANLYEAASDSYPAYAATPALALCAAILSKPKQVPNDR